MQVFGFGKKRPAVNGLNNGLNNDLNGFSGSNGVNGVHSSNPYDKAQSAAPAPGLASASAPRVQPDPYGKHSPSPARNPLQESPVANRTNGSSSVGFATHVLIL
jgi:hypothetical protein